MRNKISHLATQYIICFGAVAEWTVLWWHLRLNSSKFVKGRPINSRLLATLHRFWCSREEQSP